MGGDNRTISIDFKMSFVIELPEQSLLPQLSDELRGLRDRIEKANGIIKGATMKADISNLHDVVEATEMLASSCVRARASAHNHESD